MPDQAPPDVDIARLFRDPDMFDSSDDWADAGFKVIREHEERTIVAKHKKAEGYLFKKFSNNVSLRDQNYLLTRRYEGAQILRNIITTYGLTRIVVPKKWLVELPPKFGSRRERALILIVEEMAVVDKEDAEDDLRRADDGLVADLCRIFFMCRRLDFNARNVPRLKRSNQFAFIDTEKLQLQERPGDDHDFWKRAEKYWSGSRIKLAEKLFEAMEREHRDLRRASRR